MTASFQHRRQCRGFTLLEVVIVLAIVALLLSVIYSFAQGTLTLADNIRRAQQRDSRQQAFIGFCEHLFANLPATAKLNLRTTQDAGQYLTQLDLENVPSPFDGSPNCSVILFTEPVPGGSLRLRLTCHKLAAPKQNVSVVLFEDLSQCEWRAYDRSTRQWTTIWSVSTQPLLMELSIIQANDRRKWVFWIAPNEPVAESFPRTPSS